MLSYRDMRTVCISYMNELSRLNQNRLIRTLDTCDRLRDEKEKKFLLNSTLNIVLWDFEEAVIVGFQTFIRTKFLERLEAIKYHEANKKDCTGCKICEMGAITA